MASNRLELILSAKTKDANDALKQLDKQVDDTMGAIKSKAQEAALALGGLAIAGAALTKSFVDKAVEMQQFQATLTAVMKDADAARASLEKMTDFAASTPFDLPGVVDAGVKLTSLKLDVDRFLPLAGDLAAVFGRSIPDAANALGKSLVGSQDGLTQLADSFGIAKTELIKFGAAAKSDGSIDVTQIDKLRAALEKVVATKYGGAMAAQSKTAAGAFSNLSDAIGQLKAAFGAELADDFAKVAKALTGVIEQAEKLPASTKAMIAQAVVLGTGLAAMGAAASAAVLAFGPLALALKGFSSLSTPITLFGGLEAAITASSAAAVSGSTGMAALTGSTVATGTATVATTTSIRAMTAALLASPVAIGAIVALISTGLVVAYADAQQSAEDLRVEQQKMADRFRESLPAITAASDALKEYSGSLGIAGEATAKKLKEAGKDDLDAAKAILALTESREASFASAAEARENAAAARRKADLKSATGEEGALAKAEEGRAKFHEERAKSIQNQIAILQKAKNELSGTHAANNKAEKEAADAAKKAIETRAAAVEDYKQKAAANYWATAKEELAALDSVMVRFPVMSKEYAAYSLSRVKLAREVAKEEKDAGEKSRQSTLAAALHEVDVLKAYGDKRLGDQLALLKQILAGENLNAEERKRLELDVISTQERIADQAAQAAKKRQQDAQKAKQDLAKFEGDALQAKIRASDVTIKGLDEQLKSGKDVGDQLQAEIAARGELTKKLIEQQAAAEKIGRTAAEQAQIELKAQAELKAAKGGTEQDATKATKDAAESRKKSALEALKLERQLLEAKAESDKHVTKQDLINVAKQRLAIAEQQLQIEAGIASANASEEEKKRIAVQLELDLWKTRKASATELATATTELEKQNAELEKQKKSTFKGVQSLEDMAKDLNDGWSGANKKEPDPKAESGPTDAQVQQSATTLAIPNFKIEFVVPQGAPQDGWTFRSQQT